MKIEFGINFQGTMKVTRELTDADVEFILDWHRPFGEIREKKLTPEMVRDFYWETDGGDLPSGADIFEIAEYGFNINDLEPLVEKVKILDV